MKNTPHLPPLLALDANPLGESIRGRLKRVYDAAKLAQFQRKDV